MISPTPQKIKEARMRAGLTQTEASRVVHSATRSWQSWESTTPGDTRRMHPAIWELFLIKTK